MPGGEWGGYLCSFCWLGTASIAATLILVHASGRYGCNSQGENTESMLKSSAVTQYSLACLDPSACMHDRNQLTVTLRHLHTQVVLSADGTAAQLVIKYRPPCPVVVVSDCDAVLRGLAGYYATYPCKVSVVTDN
jgi:pyruvate kinase